MPRDGADAKRRLRSALSERRRRVSPLDAALAATVLASAALEEPRVRRAGRVVLYAACEGEIPTRALFDGLGALRIERLLPRVEPRGIVWVRVTEWEALVPGGFGILEPIGAGEALGAADVVFVPGVGFDRNGSRLGRGGGHYDQALPAGAGSPWLVGVGYSFQWLAEVPCDSRDRHMDAIVTEHGWVWRSQGVR